MHTAPLWSPFSSFCMVKRRSFTGFWKCFLILVLASTRKGGSEGCRMHLANKTLHSEICFPLHSTRGNLNFLAKIETFLFVCITKTFPCADIFLSFMATQLFSFRTLLLLSFRNLNLLSHRQQVRRVLAIESVKKSFKEPSFIFVKKHVPFTIIPDFCFLFFGQIWWIHLTTNRRTKERSIITTIDFSLLVFWSG